MNFSEDYTIYQRRFGVYEQESDTAIVSDPLYKVRIGCSNSSTLNSFSSTLNSFSSTLNSFSSTLNLVIQNVKKGTWNIIQRFRSDFPTKNAELFTFHKSINNDDLWKKIEYDLWEKIGDIFVDSGRAGIYDLKHYPNGEVITIPNGNDFDNCTTDICSIIRSNAQIVGTKITLTDDAHHSRPNGVVSSSGFGDGTYDVYVIKNSDAQIVGIKITFIDDAHIKMWNEVLSRQE